MFDGAQLKALAGRIFAMFDPEDGRVSRVDLATAMSILCGGTRDDKLFAAFCAHDVEGDGRLTYAQLSQLFHAVLVLLFETAPRAYEDIGTTSEQVASLTATCAFEDVFGDCDGSGTISFAQLQQWYSGSGAATVLSVGAALTPRNVQTVLGFDLHPFSEVVETCIEQSVMLPFGERGIDAVGFTRAMCVYGCIPARAGVILPFACACAALCCASCCCWWNQGAPGEALWPAPETTWA